jgi:hypothetical protein
MDLEGPAIADEIELEAGSLARDGEGAFRMMDRFIDGGPGDSTVNFRTHIPITTLIRIFYRNDLSE